MAWSRSEQSASYQKWYGTAFWKHQRREQMRREPWCCMCAAAGRRTKARVADHKIPHRGDWALFSDPKNLQSLCDIHASEKLRIEAGGTPKTPIGPDGWPLTS